MSLTDAELIKEFRMSHAEIEEII